MPLSCQHNSAHYANPVAPKGWPFEIRPPEGLTTTRPPYVNSLLSIDSPALPTGHNPSASYVINSLALKQS